MRTVEETVAFAYINGCTSILCDLRRLWTISFDARHATRLSLVISVAKLPLM
jgi:hypothetical protein